jgi:hypothetical protein
MHFYPKKLTLSLIAFTLATAGFSQPESQLNLFQIQGLHLLLGDLSYDNLNKTGTETNLLYFVNIDIIDDSTIITKSQKWNTIYASETLHLNNINYLGHQLIFAQGKHGYDGGWVDTLVYNYIDKSIFQHQIIWSTGKCDVKIHSQ